MCHRSRAAGILFLLFLIGFATEQPLKAYVDPGSGTMYFQVLLGGLLGGLFHLRRVTRWILRKKNDE
jgi:hypothetical protein